MRIWGKLEGRSFLVFGQKHGRDGRPLAGFVIGNLTIAVFKSEYWGWQARAAQSHMGFSLGGDWDDDGEVCTTWRLWPPGGGSLIWKLIRAFWVWGISIEEGRLFKNSVFFSELIRVIQCVLPGTPPVPPGKSHLVPRASLCQALSRAVGEWMRSEQLW